MDFEGCAGCVRNRKSYQTLSTHIAKSISKSVGNKCQIHARNIDIRNIENYQNGVPEWSRNPSEKVQQSILKFDVKKMRPEYAEPTNNGPSRGVLGGGYFTIKYW